jgi:hypothetical protein
MKISGGGGLGGKVVRCRLRLGDHAEGAEVVNRRGRRGDVFGISVALVRKVGLVAGRFRALVFLSCRFLGLRSCLSDLCSGPNHRWLASGVFLFGNGEWDFCGLVLGGVGCGVIRDFGREGRWLGSERRHWWGERGELISLFPTSWRGRQRSQ